MVYNNDENPISKLPESFKQYLNNKVDIISLFLVKKLGEIISILVLGFIVAFALLFFTFFLSYSFIQWYADNIGNESTASLIVSGFYLFIILVLYIFRKSLIQRPVQKGIIKGLDFKDIHKSTDIRKIRSTEDLDDELERLMHESDINDSEMSDNIEQIKDFYSFDSIKARFFTNVFQNPKPILSTLLQGFMSFNSYRNKRKVKKEEIENENINKEK